MSRARSSAPRLTSLGLFVALLATAIGLATFWFLREREAGSSAPPVTVAGADSLEPRAGLVEPATGDRTDASPLLAVRSAGGIEIPAGIRLPGVGRLSGRVLDRASGAPLSGVRVDLLPLPPAGAQLFGRLLHLANTGDDLEERAQPVAITGTDVAGEFVFEGVRAGRYFVAARGTRHVQDGISVARVLASGSGGPVDVWMREGGRVLGVVENPDGTPAGGARVSITAGPTFAIEAARRGDILLFETRADEAGAFVFCGIPPGPDWQVSASGGNFALTHVPDLVVRAGEDTRVLLRASAGARIVGRVLSAPSSSSPGSPGSSGPGARAEGEAPLAGAHVGAVPRGLRDLSYVTEVLEATHAVTDAEGRFSMSHVPPGEVDLLAIAPGHVPAQGPRVIAIADATLVAEDFALPSGPMVSGRVVDAAGAPLEGVVLRWNMVDLRNFNFDLTIAPLLAQAVEGFEYPKTDSDGRFVAGAFAGEKPHRIEFSRLGYKSRRVDWDPERESELTVVLHAGGAIEGVVMDAGEHRPVTRFQVSSRDRIDSEAGAPGRRNPFAGGQEVEDPAGRFRIDSMEPGKATLEFRASGYLPRTIDGLEVVEGEVLRGVIVELTRGGVVRGVVRDGEGAPVAGAQVFANAGANFKGDLRRRPPRGPMFGQDDRSTERFGRPEDLPAGMGGMLAQLGMFGDRAVLTAADGTFELDGLAEGTATIFASHRDYVLARAAPVEIVADAPPPEVAITLSRGSAIFGKATDRFGRPIQGAIVLALSPANIAGQGNAAGGGIHQGNTDGEGRYAIEHVSAGGYFVMLTRGDQALNPMSFLGTLNFDLVNVPPDERVQFDIVDQSAGACRVSGFVTAAGAPIGAGSIAALGFESESLLGVDFKLAQIGAGGEYAFVGLAPGEYTFQVTSLEKGRAPSRAQLSVEVPDLPEARIDLALPQGGIEGVVVARDSGEPVEACELVLSRQDAPRPGGILGQMLAQGNGAARARTDAKGRFRFERLEAGEWRVALRPPRRAAGEARLAQPAPLEIAVEEGLVRSDLRVELAHALALRGSARNGRGEPLEGVDVVATPRVAGMLPERARTDREGRFALENLPPGTYDVSASKDGFAAATQRGVVLTDAGGELQPLVLAEGVEASVRVLDADGRPLAGVGGRLVSESGESSVLGDAGRVLTGLFAGKGVSNTKGLLQLGNFAPGKYTLEVSRGGRRASRAVELSEGPPVTFTIRLE